MLEMKRTWFINIITVHFCCHFLGYMPGLDGACSKGQLEIEFEVLHGLVSAFTHEGSALASFTETGNGCVLVPRRLQPGIHLAFGVVEFCQRMGDVRLLPASDVN